MSHKSIKLSVRCPQKVKSMEWAVAIITPVAGIITVVWFLRDIKRERTERYFNRK